MPAAWTWWKGATIGATPLIEPTFLRPSADSPGVACAAVLHARPVRHSGLVRTDAQIGFRWDRGSPTDNLLARGEAAAGIPNDRFSIRWSEPPPVSGRYRLEWPATMATGCIYAARDADVVVFVGGLTGDVAARR